MAALTAGVPNDLSAITCPQFNPAQGTLTSYVLFDDVTRNPGPITGSLTITNIGATISQKRGSILENWQLTTFAGISTAQTGSNPFTAPVNLAPGATGSFALLAGSNNGIILPATAQTAGLSFLIGTGTVHAGDIAVTSRDPGQDGTLVLVDYAISASVDASIVYRFQLVPEPSMFALAASGAGLLFLANRMRQRVSFRAR